MQSDCEFNASREAMKTSKANSYKVTPKYNCDPKLSEHFSAKAAVTHNPFDINKLIKCV